MRAILTIGLSCLLFGSFTSAFGEDAQKSKGQSKVNEKCPITVKAVLSDCTTTYEEKTYAFCSGKCCKEFVEARTNSLYHKIGGKAAVNVKFPQTSGHD
jgi:YHS domain-containing protein